MRCLFTSASVGRSGSPSHADRMGASSGTTPMCDLNCASISACFLAQSDPVSGFRRLSSSYSFSARIALASCNVRSGAFAERSAASRSHAALAASASLAARSAANARSFRLLVASSNVHRSDVRVVRRDGAPRERLRVGFVRRRRRVIVGELAAPRHLVHGPPRADALLDEERPRRHTASQITRAPVVFCPLFIRLFHDVLARYAAGLTQCEGARAE
eukprot:30918-Pelagococcus_subviridis.AAC.25